MVRYRVAVGSSHGVKAGNLVGAIANEAGLDSEFIGRIDIRDDHSFVDLPVGMPRELVRHMRKVWVSGQQLKLNAVEDAATPRERRPHRPHRDAETPQREQRPHRPHRDPEKPPLARAHHSAAARPKPTGSRPTSMAPRSKSMTPRSKPATPRSKHRPGPNPGRPTRAKR
jgi:ATP-dependent RNA helicase DeaD